MGIGNPQLKAYLPMVQDHRPKILLHPVQIRPRVAACGVYRVLPTVDTAQVLSVGFYPYSHRFLGIA